MTGGQGQGHGHGQVERRKSTKAVEKRVIGRVDISENKAGRANRVRGLLCGSDRRNGPKIMPNCCVIDRWHAATQRTKPGKVGTEI